MNEPFINRVHCCGQWWNVADYEEYVSASGEKYVKFTAAPMTPPWYGDDDQDDIILDMRVPIHHINAVAHQDQ